MIKQSLRSMAALLLCSVILITPIGFSARHAFSQDAPLLKIGEVQGAVTDDEAEPQTFKSPYSNDRVQVQGIVTNLMMIDTSGRQLNLFFLQETPENSDGDPNTSDAIQVLIGAKTAFDDYTPVLGDIITVEGKVEEFYDMTRLREINLVSVDGAVDLNTAVPVAEFNPAGDALAVAQMSERLESMRVFVPEMSYTISGTHLYASSNDTEVYVMRGDAPVAQRENLYERRVFRDTEALDDSLPNDNPYRISVEANVLKGLAYDYNVNLPPYSTYEVFTSPLTGNLVYAFARYTLQIDTLPEVQAGVAPDQNTPIVAADPATQFTVATFNVENLYDFYNDPFDINDNPENLAFNYVPRTLEAYQTHITKLARQIVEAMHSPDIIALEEVEDQDVCVSGGLIYGTCGGDTDNANSLPDVLEDLAIEISNLTSSAVIYMPAIDRDSADTRGITQAFLYRTDRVSMPIAPEDPILGPRPEDPNADKFPMNQEISNPKSLSRMFAIGTPQYDRAPLVGLFYIYPNGMTSPESAYIEMYVSANHFISNPDASNVLREGQAAYNIELAQSVLALNPDAYFIVAGDLNNYPYSSEVSLFDAVFNNLWDEIPAVSRYTYIYQGQTQTLDQILVTPALANLLASVGVAHVNSDYPYQFSEDPTSLYAVTDHDPVVATFNFPTE